MFGHLNCLYVSKDAQSDLRNDDLLEDFEFPSLTFPRGLF